MATTRKLVDLFRAIATEDIGGAAAIAAQVCKSEEKMGHRTAARLLRGALHPSGNGSPANGHGRLMPLHTREASIASTALVRLQDDKSLTDVVLTPTVRGELESVVLEWKHRERLNEHQISPRSKLLFHGPPGCGKSLTAQALGRELGIPVYMVRFDAVIGAYLGQTAIHLRQLFHFAETTPCVLLLDELDALGKKRGNPLDVGELDRIVISLMQELEHSKPMGMIVGTSNLPKHLDAALWRRFDLDVFFKLPTQQALRVFVKRIASQKRVVLPARVIGSAVRARTFAAAEATVIAEVRRQALKNV
jgi:SpoVK/Ycf46/Vps4 family AAA+-type ATPase